MWEWCETQFPRQVGMVTPVWRGNEESHRRWEGLNRASGGSHPEALSGRTVQAVGFPTSGIWTVFLQDGGVTSQQLLLSPWQGPGPVLAARVQLWLRLSLAFPQGT